MSETYSPCTGVNHALAVAEEFVHLVKEFLFRNVVESALDGMFHQFNVRREILVPDLPLHFLE